MKKAKRCLAIAIVLMLISCIVTCTIQTNCGKVEVKEINWITDNGYAMNAWLFIPENATTETPAPGVVVSHGMFNNKGMQDLNFVELARRGFVVLAQDMPSHGDSDDVNGFGPTMMGLYESVKELAGMPFVDSENIGITGHSLGGMSCNTAVTLDNMAPTRLVKAVLLNSADGTYTDSDGNFVNVYGSRDVGIVAGMYDEWFFDDVDADGNPTLPKDFVANKNAQSLLHFGTDPAGQDVREANTVYTEEIDGEEAMRVIYNHPIIHPWSHFSSRSTKGTIEFFTQSLGAPNPIDSNNQIWQWKEAFNAVGLVGFFMFMTSLAIVLAKKPYFAEIACEETVLPRETAKGGKAWFWGCTAAGVAFGTISYFPILNYFQGKAGYISGVSQSSPRSVGMWALACGLFSILTMVVSYLAYGKKNGMDLKETGVCISVKKLAKTILLAAIVLAATTSTVFIADYFFKADFRLWVLAIRAFKVKQLGLTFAPYAFLFLVYYVANSVAVNCFNYNKIGGKGNIAILAISAGLPAVILLLMQYIPYFSGSDLMWPNWNMYGVWLFPMLVILPGAAVISRIIYRETKNPYLPGIICGVMVALSSCINTLTMVG